MTGNLYATDSSDFEQLHMLGFSESEAARLVYMKHHVEEQVEYRELMEERHRLDFARWLVEHDRLKG